jgi:DNA modification methylase
VADFFGGSGSTLIACEKVSRRCYLMELDPLYADVIVQRYEQFTGKKAERVTAETSRPLKNAAKRDRIFFHRVIDGCCQTESD